VQFGRKAGKIEPSRSGGGDWPRGLRAGETRVRFLAEIPDWQEYWEHYDPTVNFFPCTGDKKTCPGCTSSIERTAKATKRYLAPVLDPHTGRVWGLKMATDLANRLSLRADRNNGTVTNRDYTLIRTGSGLETEYDVEQEEKVAIDLGVYEGSFDLQDMLASQFAAAWPDFDIENPNGAKAQEQPEPRKRAPRKQAQPAQSAQEAEVDKGPGIREQIQESARKAQAERERVEQSDDPPSEAAPEPESGEPEQPSTKKEQSQQAQIPQDQGAQSQGDEEMVELTEEDLRKMPRTELIKLARRADLGITLTMSREQIVDLFLEQFAV